ncbi:hypothetical protein [Tautonia marina]|uniref:hypothetical protein n=1 Tax=Tautonia marina TaxID=2653855 RepID=UPI0012604495|nr:hypothetical protein [Tautonia marina]
MDQSPPADREPFEFRPDHGHLIADLGSKLHFVGILTILLGAIALLSGLLNRPPGTPLWTGGTLVAALSALFLVAVGFWSVRSGREFLLVAQTEGADIPHLMRALENLRRLVSLQYNLAWFGLILLVLLIVFGFFIDPAH